MALVLIGWVGVTSSALFGAYAAATKASGVVFVVLFVPGVATLVGVYERARRQARTAATPPPRLEERVESAITRLSMLADISAPAVRVTVERAPLSWTVVVPRRSPEIWLTTGLLERVSDSELEAVVGHELSHVAHRDATLMSIVAGPPAALFEGYVSLLEAASGNDSAKMGVSLYVACVAPIALTLAVLGRVVSRHRELVADRGAAILTGSPAVLASVLLRLSDDLVHIPEQDLRAVAARDPFHLLPARPRDGLLAWLWATHPPLSRRLDQLEQMEYALQHAREGDTSPL
jgi:heat shock protein HtpX